jgi:hypothetical protein
MGKNHLCFVVVKKQLKERKTFEGEKQKSSVPPFLFFFFFKTRPQFPPRRRSTRCSVDSFWML